MSAPTVPRSGGTRPPVVVAYVSHSTLHYGDDMTPARTPRRDDDLDAALTAGQITLRRLHAIQAERDAREAAQ